LLDEFNHLVDLLLDLLVVHSFFSASKSHTKKCRRERGVVFSERASANRILNGGCASFSRAVMSEDDLVFFVSFYPKILFFLSVPF
jgi:hypothetical protein